MIENRDYFIEKWREKLKSENALVRYKVKQFIKIVEKSEQIREFNVHLLLMFVEKMTLFEGKKIIVRLHDATEIEVAAE
ncbi:hypothetical protein [Clostridium saccharoperbutylacetonicum]